jgi:hypothetical protein
MKSLFIASACLVGLSLAGCSTVGGGTVSPSVVSAEQQAFNFGCPTIQSGALDPVVATFNSNVQAAYADAKKICNVGVISTPGQFAADFLIIQPIIMKYLTL